MGVTVGVYAAAIGGCRRWVGQCMVTALVVLCYVSLAVCSTDIALDKEPQVNQYCSFFSNRAPTAQPGLNNCTWFKSNSCCLQQEIRATFGRMKPLIGASEACQRYINYLMCYICAPNQNIFYQKERLTVCEEFCDSLYDACKTAILKGSVIGELYDGGRQFCHSRRFLVNTRGCFTFDVALDTSSGHSNRLCQHYFCSVILWLLIFTKVINVHDHIISYIAV